MDFYRKYCDIRVRVGPYRTKEGFEYEKTVSIIDAFANRAKDIHDGCNVSGRFGWGGDATEENMLESAYSYLEKLEAGEFPLKGMFTEPGGSLIDHSFIEKDGVMHVFYNRGYLGYLWDQRFVDSLGHATSTDLINWEIQIPAYTARLGGFDDYQSWSPGVLEHEGKYYMFYTGVNFNIAQAICLAVSDDLYHWERFSPEPILTPGPWCDWDPSKWSDCRDSFVLKDDDGMFYMYYCSTEVYTDEEGNRKSRAVVGSAKSTDLFHWEDCGPMFIPGVPHNAESPFVLKKDGKYYLFFTNVGIGTAWAVSDNPLKGWFTLPGEENILVRSGCSEVFQYKGQWYISLATYRGRGEQYLQIANLSWDDNGYPVMGEILK